MKVVVIDDDPTVLEVAQATLEQMGHETTTRSSALGASAWILAERPDVVLVDLGMPALPGDEWLRLVTREGLATADGYMPTFVVLSSRPEDELAQVVADTCAVGFIAKQGGPEHFEATFKELVGKVAS